MTWRPQQFSDPWGDETVKIVEPDFFLAKPPKLQQEPYERLVFIKKEELSPTFMTFIKTNQGILTTDWKIGETGWW